MLMKKENSKKLPLSVSISNVAEIMSKSNWGDKLHIEQRLSDYYSITLLDGEQDHLVIKSDNDKMIRASEKKFFLRDNYDEKSKKVKTPKHIKSCGNDR